MSRLSYRYKIFFFIGVLLLAVQAVSFVLVTDTSRKRITERAEADIMQAQKVMTRYVDDLSQQALLISNVSVRDFTVKQYLAGDDAATRLSVVENIAARAYADWGGFVDLRRDILDFTAASPAQLRSSPYVGDVIAALRESGEATLIGVGAANGSAQLMTVIAVDYPRTLGYMIMGFTLDSKTLLAMSERLPIDAQLSVYLPDSATLSASQFPDTVLPNLRQYISGMADHGGMAGAIRANLGGKAYEIAAWSFPRLGSVAVVELVVANSLAKVATEQSDLAMTFAVIFSASMVLAALAAGYLSDRLAKPIIALTETAKEVEGGAYPDVPAVNRRDEIGSLAKSFETMTKRVQDREVRLAYQASHDPETGLYNRQELLSQVPNTPHQAILVLHVEALEKLSYTLGRKVAGSVMDGFTQTLQAIAGEDGIAARLNTDRFAIVNPDTCFEDGQCKDLQDCADHVHHQLFEDAIPADGYDIDIHGFVAAAVIDPDINAATSLGRAEAALFRARTHNQPTALYDPDQDEPDINALTLIGEMRKGFDNGEIQLYVQPKIDLATGKTVEAEALVRWFHETRGFIPPDDFIPLCEQTGRIHLLTSWITAKASVVLERWRSEGNMTRLAINLSAHDLTDINFPEQLRGSVAAAGITPQDLVLEITESAVMGDKQLAIEVMHSLAASGFDLAIDDFGTGYSSLEYLRQLPVSEVKIDRSFVQDLATNADNRTIVKAAIQMAHGLCLNITAEGVEDMATVDILRDFGCDKAQGYFFSRPQSIADFETFLTTSPYGQPSVTAA